MADTGPGIPEHERTRIFDRFHQVDSSLTKAKGGAGLGLPIVKQIVEMHGGNIWVESKIGRDHQRIFSHQTDDDSRFESVLLIAHQKGKRIWQHLGPDLDERTAKH